MDKVAEHRTIIFPKSVLVSALSRECVRVKRRIPRGTLVTVDVLEEDESIVARLTLEDPDGKPLLVHFESSFIAASLMRYCFKEKIVLPRTAHKSLAIHGDNIALVLRLNMSVVDANVEGELEVA